jgi:cyclophilin family peptidyl-prolyl cis-trans isomerase
VQRLLASLALAIALWYAPTGVQAQANPENTIVLTLKTGRVVIQLMPDIAPKHVERIKTLARRNFYDGLKFHRVISGFMAQTGDPRGNGTGGSDLPDLQSEFSRYVFKRGTVGMARSRSPHSANSQFFICFDNEGCRDLTGQYTVWGQVIEGMEHVDRITVGEPPRAPDIIVRMQVGADVR